MAEPAKKKRRVVVLEDDETVEEALEREKAKDKAKELEGGRMPFLAHLVELRDRVRKAAMFFMAATIICWIKADAIFTWLKAPLFRVWDVKRLGEPNLVFGKLTEPFWVSMSIAMWA